MSFKVKHIRVTGKPIKRSVTPQNNTDFISDGSRDMATEFTKNRRFWLSFEAPSPRNLHEYPHEPYTA